MSLASVPEWGPEGSGRTAPDGVARGRIAQLLAHYPVFDGHNDLPMRLLHDHDDDVEAADLTSVHLTRHTDIPRLRAGGVGAQFWSVFVPPTLPGPQAVVATLKQIDCVYALVARHPQVFTMARTAAEVRAAMRAGTIASLIGVEGGHQIDESLAVLRMYHVLGVRYLTLTHTITTSWADAATDVDSHGGLTAFGREVVAELNRLGMLVDLSHVSTGTMSDALDVSRAPVVFSHSSCRELTDHPRNVPTQIMDRLRANGGVQMLTMVPSFVSQECADHEAARDREVRRLGLDPHDPRGAVPEGAAAQLVAWDRAHPRPRATLAQVVAHLEFAREILGVDHIGFGADFDGVADLPEGITGVDAYPAVLEALLDRGWSQADLAQLTCLNVLRVLQEAQDCTHSGGPTP